MHISDISLLLFCYYFLDLGIGFTYSVSLSIYCERWENRKAIEMCFSSYWHVFTPFLSDDSSKFFVIFL